MKTRYEHPNSIQLKKNFFPSPSHENPGPSKGCDEKIQRRLALLMRNLCFRAREKADTHQRQDWTGAQLW
jgi:hypothetical protein